MQGQQLRMAANDSNAHASSTQTDFIVDESMDMRKYVHPVFYYLFYHFIYNLASPVFDATGDQIEMITKHFIPRDLYDYYFDIYESMGFSGMLAIPASVTDESDKAKHQHVIDVVKFLNDANQRKQFYCKDTSIIERISQKIISSANFYKLKREYGKDFRLSHLDVEFSEAQSAERDDDPIEVSSDKIAKVMNGLTMKCILDGQRDGLSLEEAKAKARQCLRSQQQLLQDFLQESTNSMRTASNKAEMKEAVKQSLANVLRKANRN